jgi:hypothetical protein
MKNSILKYKWWLVLALIVASLFVGVIVAGKDMVAEGPDYAPDVFSDVVEVDGVLYFPDGSPVRNYEQLEVYLNSK